MGPKGSKAKRPTPTKTKAVIIPRAPQNAIIRTPQGTVPVPPRDTLPVPLQDTLPIIPRDTTTTTSQDTDSIPPQDTVQTVLVLLQDTIPRIPHDIIIEILGHLASDSELQSIQACALISRSWVQPCQRHLFHTAVFTPANARAWLRTFPMQEVSPAHHVRVFRIDIGRDFYIPEEFFECIPSFTDVDKMTLLGSGWVLQGEGLGWIPLGYGSLPLWEPSCWKLPRSVTSLTISTGAITLVQVWDIMAQLPNLNDLALSWFAQEVRKQLPTTGTVLKGRFGGRLTLGGRGVGDDVINMLLEIPSGLRFAELEMECTENRLPPSAVRLAEVCGETLVKLSHRVVLRSKSYPFTGSVGTRNIDADVISSSSSPRHLRAVLRLFQIPKHSRGDLWP